MTEPQTEYIITEEQLRLFYECALIHDVPDAPTICAFIRSRPATTSAEVLEELFAPMDKFYGKMTKTQIIKWSVKQQNSFITNATATYLLARELQQQEKKGA